MINNMFIEIFLRLLRKEIYLFLDFRKYSKIIILKSLRIIFPIWVTNDIFIKFIIYFNKKNISYYLLIYYFVKLSSTLEKIILKSIILFLKLYNNNNWTM